MKRIWGEMTPCTRHIALPLMSSVCTDVTCAGASASETSAKLLSVQGSRGMTGGRSWTAWASGGSARAQGRAASRRDGRRRRRPGCNIIGSEYGNGRIPQSTGLWQCGNRMPPARGASRCIAVCRAFISGDSHEIFHRRHPRRLPQRPHHPGGCRAGLPDHLIHLRRQPAWRGPLQPGGARQHLHAHHEPHQCGAGGARGGPGGWRRCAGAGFGHDGHHLCAAGTVLAGQQHRLHQSAVRRHLQPVRAQPAQPGHPVPLRGSRRSGCAGSGH